MPMGVGELLTQLNDAVNSQSPENLAYLLQLNPSTSHGKELAKTYRRSLDKQSLLNRFRADNLWGEIAVQYTWVCVNIANKRWKEAFQEQDMLVTNFGKFFSENSGWTLRALFTILRDLRTLALQADEWQKINENKRDQENMRKAATSIQPFLSRCIQDRNSPPELSRRWGVYYIVNLILKCYFRVHTVNLSRNILRAISNSRDIPPLERYPRSHQVTYHYYLGMTGFYNQDFAKAENELTLAFYNCYLPDRANQERILAYLIPLRVLKGHLPSEELLGRFPVLAGLYRPFIKAIRSGNVSAYDRALEENEPTLLLMDLWLAMERAKEVCLRGLFRRVWRASPNPSRVPISHFHVALKLCGNDVDVQEAECLVATMIYKGFMRGYISHEKQMVVLAQTNAFPRPADRSSPLAVI